MFRLFFIKILFFRNGSWSFVDFELLFLYTFMSPTYNLLHWFRASNLWYSCCRNQRMTEDQSVLGRRRIYYDQNGGEALICSDSEEEIIDEEAEKRDFIESEDYILRLV